MDLYTHKGGCAVVQVLTSFCVCLFVSSFLLMTFMSITQSPKSHDLCDRVPNNPNSYVIWAYSQSVQ